MPENKFSQTHLQQQVAENRAEPVRTMAASFARKPFLFSEVLSTILGRFIWEIDSPGVLLTTNPLVLRQ